MPRDLLGPVAAYVATLVLGTGVGLRLYGRLLARLRERHPDTFRELGEPRLYDTSPRRGLALQGFIYSRGLSDEDPELRRLCRRAALFVPVLLGAVLGVMLWFGTAVLGSG